MGSRTDCPTASSSAWKSTPGIVAGRTAAGDFGPGQILLVGDVMLVQAESGDVVMVEANPDKLVELGRIPALSDQTWNNPCLYDHFLFVRNSVEAACYELPRRTTP